MALEDKVISMGKLEFVNLTPLDVNPGISECEISVCYEGLNRNGSYIDHDELISLAKTLRGVPIVGAYEPNDNDFTDHGEMVTIKNGNIDISCLTVPYGFVAPDAKVWLQDVREYDGDGLEVEHTYLMTTGYLWTGQFPESEVVISQGRPQSMEFNPDNMKGHWAEDREISGYEFFVIDEGTELSKLCILGKNVPPCFEGAEITKPQMSINFSLSEGFEKTLFNMMNDLTEALQNKGGLNNMDLQKDEELFDKAQETHTTEESEASQDTFQSEIDPSPIVEEEEIANVESFDNDEFAKKEDKEETEEVDEDTDDVKEETDEDEEKKDGFKKKRCSSLNDSESEYQAELDALRAEVEELRAFKLAQENAEKDAVINKYHMLDEADKADVIANKENYSLEEIDAKLALIYVQKNVDFSTVDGEVETEPEEEPATTFNLDEPAQNNILPSWISAVIKTKESR